MFAKDPTVILMLINAGAVLAAALVDFFSRKIPNVHVAVMAVCGLAYFAVHDLSGLFYHLLSGLYTACIVIILFQRKIFGGGDAKMLAALALWFTPQQLPQFAIMTLVCGGVLGTIYLAYYAFTLAAAKFFPDARLHKIDPKGGMPYGVATAFGFAMTGLRVL